MSPQNTFERKGNPVKEQQRIAIANTIAKKLNERDPAHATENAEAAQNIARAIVNLNPGLGYCEEAPLGALQGAFDILASSLPTVFELFKLAPIPAEPEALTS